MKQKCPSYISVVIKKKNPAGKQLREERFNYTYNSRLQSIIIVGKLRQELRHHIHSQEQKEKKHMDPSLLLACCSLRSYRSLASGIVLPTVSWAFLHQSKLLPMDMLKDQHDLR